MDVDPVLAQQLLYGVQYSRVQAEPSKLLAERVAAVHDPDVVFGVGLTHHLVARARKQLRQYAPQGANLTLREDTVDETHTSLVETSDLLFRQPVH